MTMIWPPVMILCKDALAWIRLALHLFRHQIQAWIFRYLFLEALGALVERTGAWLVSSFPILALWWAAYRSDR